jgi:hypothetical protein
MVTVMINNDDDSGGGDGCGGGVVYTPLHCIQCHVLLFTSRYWPARLDYYRYYFASTGCVCVCGWVVVALNLNHLDELALLSNLGWTKYRGSRVDGCCSQHKVMPESESYTQGIGRMVIMDQLSFVDYSR